jgi:hypothetical protein
MGYRSRKRREGRAKRNEGKPLEHNYLQVLRDFAAENRLPPGSMTEVETLHDDWCGIFQGKRCDCNPVVRRAEADLNPLRN